MRLRLLPFAIFTLVLLLGAKLFDVWTDIGALSIATVNAQEQPAADAAAAPDAADPGATQVPTPTPANQPAQAPAVPATAQMASAVPAPQLTKPSDFPSDPTLYSQADVDVLQKLAQRRTELESWANDLAMREQLLKAAEGKVEDRVGELKTVQTSIKGLLKQYDQEQENKLKSLVKVYETMKPKDAARIFEELDMDVLLDVVERMKEAKLSPILAAMASDKAKTVTIELAQRRKMGVQAAASSAN
jgi:flagellar motility protein MotE (MotC chaperone)